MSEPYLSPRTAEKLATGAVKGQRHGTMMSIAIDMAGNGFSKGDIFQSIRKAFPDEDKSNKEIVDIIDWAFARNPEPAGYSDRPRPVAPARDYVLEQKPAAPKISPLDAAKKACGSTLKNYAWWQERSIPGIPSDPLEQAILLIESLYLPDDKLNFVREFFIDTDGKAKPHGGGVSKTRDSWIRHLRDQGLPASDSGIWVRPNPCGPGTGKAGAIKDEDITAFRFAFLESDILPPDLQLSLYARMKLPIAAIITSGGQSCHAWVRIDGQSLEDYRSKVTALYAAIDGFGFDKANKNASRLSRLPGALRTHGLPAPAYQRLVYLNPSADSAALTAQFLDTLPKLLSEGPVEEFPLHDAVLRALERYDDIIRNKGRTGVPTGITAFDKMSGGLKKKRFYVLAAESKAGKTSFAINVANHAAKEKIHTAIFSMEMDVDEIVDMFISMNARVDRNLFNTGDFAQMDYDRVLITAPPLCQYPVHVFDEPMQTADWMKNTVMRLKAEVPLGLIIVDYLQLITPTNDRDSREQQIAAIGMGLRRLCVEADCPVVALSQINDEGKLRESRAVGHCAHAVMLLEEVNPGNDAGTRELRFRIERARAMPRGAYPVVFEPNYCKMYQGDHEVWPQKEESKKFKKFGKF